MGFHRLNTDETGREGRLFRGGIILSSLLLLAALLLSVFSLIFIAKPYSGIPVSERVAASFVRDASEEDYDEDCTVCRVVYRDEAGHSFTVNYPYEEYSVLPGDDSRTGFWVEDADGVSAAFPEGTVSDSGIVSALRASRVELEKGRLNLALALLLVAIGFLIMTFFGHAFSLYEKIWFLSILALASVFALLFPEEDCNGVNGLLIMALYLADTLLNILCELLISKQSKWNFLVSVGVEITEILICVVLAYRFATMVTTLFFWLPIDVISFINWNRHPDRAEKEITEVRRLTGLQEILVLLGIALWTVGVGALLSGLDVSTDLFGGNRTLETVVCYLDACASAVGIANGLFILFRFREQWAAWFTVAILEAVINILSGQIVLLVLKFGYLTNTAYGFFKWTKYIKDHPEARVKKSFF